MVAGPTEPLPAPVVGWNPPKHLLCCGGSDARWMGTEQTWWRDMPDQPEVARRKEAMVRDADAGGFPPQEQQPPGPTSRMDPSPDHGEDSYVGHERLTGMRALITGGDSGIG